MIQKYLSSEKINTENGFSCGYVHGHSDSKTMHNHDYYELIIITKGSPCHIINSKKHTLSEGNLLFIRRQKDIHTFLPKSDEYFEYIYISVTSELLFSVFKYLGSEFPSERMLKSEDPPVVTLSHSDMEKLTKVILNFDQVNNTPTSRLKIKTLMADIFINHFVDFEEKEIYIPSWLEKAYTEMKKPEYFIEGTSKFAEISNKTREHLTRSLKKYYGLSPNEYISNLRLNYAIELMVKTNEPLTDICFNCGFESLSWFYKLFKRKYKTTPAMYREKYKTKYYS